MSSDSSGKWINTVPHDERVSRFIKEYRSAHLDTSNSFSYDETMDVYLNKVLSDVVYPAAFGYEKARPTRMPIVFCCPGGGANACSGRSEDGLDYIIVNSRLVSLISELCFFFARRYQWLCEYSGVDFVPNLLHKREVPLEDEAVEFLELACRIFQRLTFNSGRPYQFKFGEKEPNRSSNFIFLFEGCFAWLLLHEYTHLLMRHRTTFTGQFLGGNTFFDYALDVSTREARDILNNPGFAPSKVQKRTVLGPHAQEFEADRYAFVKLQRFSHLSVSKYSISSEHSEFIQALSCYLTLVALQVDTYARARLSIPADKAESILRSSKPFGMSLLTQPSHPLIRARFASIGIKGGWGDFKPSPATDVALKITWMMMHICEESIDEVFRRPELQDIVSFIYKGAPDPSQLPRFQEIRLSDQEVPDHSLLALAQRDFGK